MLVSHRIGAAIVAIAAVWIGAVVAAGSAAAQATQPARVVPADGSPLIERLDLAAQPKRFFTTRVTFEPGHYVLWVGAPRTEVSLASDDRRSVRFGKARAGSGGRLVAFSPTQRQTLGLTARAFPLRHMGLEVLELRIVRVDELAAGFASWEAVAAARRTAQSLHNEGKTRPARTMLDRLSTMVTAWVGPEHPIALEIAADCALYETRIARMLHREDERLARSRVAADRLREVLRDQRASPWLLAPARAMSVATTADTLADALADMGDHRAAIDLRRAMLAEIEIPERRLQHATGLARDLMAAAMSEGSSDDDLRDSFFEGLRLIDAEYDRFSSDQIVGYGEPAEPGAVGVGWIAGAHRQLAVSAMQVGEDVAALGSVRIILDDLLPDDAATDLPWTAREIQIDALDVLAVIEQHMGEPERARAALDRSLAIRDQLRTRSEASIVRRAARADQLGLGEAGARLAMICIELGDHIGALDAIERSRYRGYMDLLGFDPGNHSLRQSGTQTGGAELHALIVDRIAGGERRIADLAAELENATEDRWPGLFEAYESERTDLEINRDALATIIGESLKNVGPRSAADIAAALGPDEALLVYAWSRLGLGVVAVTADGTAGERVAGPAGLEQIVLLCTDVEEFALGPSDDPSLALGQLEKLGGLLLPGSVRELVADRTRLVVVPAGPLSTLPIQAVLGSALDAQVVAAPTASMHLGLRERPGGLAAAGSGSAVILGRPTYPAGRDAPTDALAHLSGGASALDVTALLRKPVSDLFNTEPEARAVDTFYQAGGWTTELLLDNHATPQRLRSAVERHRPRVLHVATHGLTGSADRPMDAALLLAAADTHRSFRESCLTLEQLFNSWYGLLDGCELVVLSACETGRGEQVGSGELSLAWGFFYAGSRTVVASLWEVDDAATALLMRRFHENRTGAFDAERSIHRRAYRPGEPMPVAAALSEAKSWLRNQPRDPDAAGHGNVPNAGSDSGFRFVQTTAADGTYAHPFYWSGWVTIGAGD